MAVHRKGGAQMSIPSAGIDPGAVEKLRARFHGALLRPGEDGYEEARRVWNGEIDRRPGLIARCSGPDDVALAVRFARERDLAVSVKGGGHAVAGYAVCDAGLMIDLSLMKAVRVDTATRTARAAGGLLWSELDRATQSQGLAPPNPFLPPEHYGKPIVGVLLVWAGDPASGQKAIAPLRAIATPIADVVRPVPYLFLQGIFDGGAPHGIHYYWKSHRLPRLTDEVIDAVVQRTSPRSRISGW